jgi:hypothetical protein
MEWYELEKNDLIIQWHLKKIIENFVLLHFYDGSYFLCRKFVDNTFLLNSKDITLYKDNIKDEFGKDISYLYKYKFLAVIDYETYIKINTKEQNFIVFFNNNDEFTHFILTENSGRLRKSLFFKNWMFKIDGINFNDIIIFSLTKSHSKNYINVLNKLIHYECYSKKLMTDEIMESLKNLKIRDIV